MRLIDRVRRRWLQWRWQVWQGQIIDKHGLDCAMERAKRESVMEALDTIRLRSR